MQAKELSFNEEVFEIVKDWDEVEWWRDPDIAKPLGLTVERLAAAMDVVQKHINKDWLIRATKQGGGQAVIEYLIGKGLLPASRLYQLGLTLDRLHQVDGFDRKLKDLASRTSISTYFEMQVGHLFAECGFSIRFPKENGEKIADIHAEFGGEPFAIECKNLNKELWEDWELQLLTSISDAIGSRLHNTSLNYRVILDPDISSVHSANNTEFNTSFASTLASDIADLVEELADRTEPEVASACLGTLAMVIVGPEEKVVECGVDGCEVSQFSKLRRFLTNAVDRALQQLPSDRSGIIAVSTEFVPDVWAMKDVLRAQLRRESFDATKIAGILVFPKSTIFAKQTNYYFENRLFIPDNAVLQDFSARLIKLSGAVHVTI